MVPDDLTWETSLSHMTRVPPRPGPGQPPSESQTARGTPTEAPAPSGRGLRRGFLRRTPKSVTGRYYLLLSGHAVIGRYLRDKVHNAVEDKC